MSVAVTIPTQTTVNTNAVDASTVSVNASGGRLVLDDSDCRASASGDVIGAMQVCFQLAIADATADTDIVVTNSIRVIKFEFLNTGGAAHATLDTVQLKNGTSAITDAVVKTATVNALVKAATYDPTKVVIAAGGTLRVSAAHNTNVAGIAYITAVRA